MPKIAGAPEGARRPRAGDVARPAHHGGPRGPTHTHPWRTKEHLHSGTQPSLGVPHPRSSPCSQHVAHAGPGSTPPFPPFPRAGLLAGAKWKSLPRNTTPTIYGRPPLAPGSASPQHPPGSPSCRPRQWGLFWAAQGYLKLWLGLFPGEQEALT